MTGFEHPPIRVATIGYSGLKPTADTWFPKIVWRIPRGRHRLNVECGLSASRTEFAHGRPVTIETICGIAIRRGFSQSRRPLCQHGDRDRGTPPHLLISLGNTEDTTPPRICVTENFSADSCETAKPCRSNNQARPPHRRPGRHPA
jgi:hypothetical protein